VHVWAQWQLQLGGHGRCRAPNLVTIMPGWLRFRVILTKNTVHGGKPSMHYSLLEVSVPNRRRSFSASDTATASGSLPALVLLRPMCGARDLLVDAGV